jgi:hypothetical protein
MSLLISSVYTYDADASAYILAVEAADEIASPGIGALEPATRSAINKFVVGCKADGIWNAIKASCILAGARTRLGALTPLVGTAPDSFNFVDANYNRKTGLVGNGTNSYLDSNRNNNVDPQNSKHVSVYINTVGSLGFMGSGAGGTAGTTQLYSSGPSYLARNNETSSATTIGAAATGLFGTSRNSGTSYAARLGGVQTTVNVISDTPNNANLFVFNIPTLTYFTTARLAFYSIGQSLDLARLDARVTDLINAFAVTIP